MTSTVTQLGKQGRIVIPASLRRQLGLLPGDDLVLRVDDGALIVEPIARTVAGVQGIVAGYLGSDHHIVDELIAERMAESAGD